MALITEKAPAKLNLTLDITSKRSDGYHTIMSVMQSISLYDTVSVCENGSGDIYISSNLPYLPCDSNNICHKAATLFFEAAKIKNPGISITLNKIIPIASGMAGGSSDAAALLKILKRLYGYDGDIISLAAKIGADVPFCVKGGSCLCQGIGDELTEIKRGGGDIWVVVAKNTRKQSTAQIYTIYDEKRSMVKKRPDSPAMIRALEAGNKRAIADGLCNVFEAVIFQPAIQRLKEELVSLGALGAAMTGAGSAVFGIFESLDCAEAAVTKLRSENTFACSARFI